MSLTLISPLLITANGAINRYKPDEITPTKFQTLVKQDEYNAHLLLSIYDDDNNIYFYIDYGSWITDYSEPAICTTWNEIIDLLTNNDAYRLGYTWSGITSISELPYSDVLIWDCMHIFNTFTLDYGDGKLGQHGNYFTRYTQKDLYIAIANNVTEDIPDLNLCIPVVNGFLCEPICTNGDTSGRAIYAKYGAQLCWQPGVHRTPEVQLLDFSRFDGILIRKFNNDAEDTSTDTLYFQGRTGTFNLDARWSIHTPLSLDEYVPIVVLCGVPIFPDRITRETLNVFNFEPNKVPLNYALALRKYLTDESVDSGIAYQTSSVETMYNNGDLFDLSFIIYVKCTRLYTIRELMDVWGNYITVNNYTPDGILISNVTDTIAAYNKAQYADHMELTIQNQEDLYMADHLFEQGQLLFISPDCRHHNSRNLKESNCTMVYLIRGSHD